MKNIAIITAFIGWGALTYYIGTTKAPKNDQAPITEENAEATKKKSKVKNESNEKIRSNSSKSRRRFSARAKTYSTDRKIELIKDTLAKSGMFSIKGMVKAHTLFQDLNEDEIGQALSEIKNSILVGEKSIQKKP
jgi:hypothetical protein